MKLYVVIVNSVYRGFNDPIYASQDKNKAIAKAIEFINNSLTSVNKSDLIEELLEWGIAEDFVGISELDYEME